MVREGRSLGTSVNETTGTAAIAGNIGTGATTVADIGITTAAADKELALATGGLKASWIPGRFRFPGAGQSGLPIRGQSVMAVKFI